jgi:hypothetical protein
MHADTGDAGNSSSGIVIDELSRGEDRQYFPPCQTFAKLFRCIRRGFTEHQELTEKLSYTPG